MDDDARYTIEDLAAAVDVPVRTVRYYLAEGLLPGPGMRGRGTLYTSEHLQRLRLIRLLVSRRVPLVEVRDRVVGLTDEDVSRQIAREEELALRLKEEAVTSSPRSYVADLLYQAESDARLHRPASPARSPALARPSAPPPSPGATATPRAESWRRWPLLPGLELHVRDDALVRYRQLIGKLTALARGQPESGEP